MLRLTDALNFYFCSLLLDDYEDELIEEPQHRETIIENIETEGAASC
jgi:hypothetical protein